MVGLTEKEKVKELLEAEKFEDLYALKRDIIYRQAKELVAVREIYFTCICGKQVSCWYAYRCLECGIRFCRDCAKEHFA